MTTGHALRRHSRGAAYPIFGGCAGLGRTPSCSSPINPEVIADLLRQSHREQGLPERISDRSAIARLPVLVASTAQ